MITLCKNCDNNYSNEECEDDGHEIYEDSYCGSCSIEECKTCPYDECPVPINERPYKKEGAL
jgi:hypothetical protein